MMNSVLMVYKYRIYPTTEQEILLSKAFGYWIRV